MSLKPRTLFVLLFIALAAGSQSPVTARESPAGPEDGGMAALESPDLTETGADHVAAPVPAPDTRGEQPWVKAYWWLLVVVLVVLVPGIIRRFIAAGRHRET